MQLENGDRADRRDADQEIGALDLALERLRQGERRLLDVEVGQHAAVEPGAEAVLGGLSLSAARIAAHGIAFSPTAEAHHHAAILDYFDNPDAPTLISHKHLSWCHPIPTSDPDQSAANWQRHLALCRPLADRDIAHDHAVRAELVGLRHLTPHEAAMTAAALPRPQPRRLGQPPRRANCG